MNAPYSLIHPLPTLCNISNRVLEKYTKKLCSAIRHCLLWQTKQIYCRENFEVHKSDSFHAQKTMNKEGCQNILHALLASLDYTFRLLQPLEVHSVDSEMIGEPSMREMFMFTIKIKYGRLYSGRRLWRSRALS
jgi:hypothetical protein